MFTLELCIDSTHELVEIERCQNNRQAYRQMVVKDNNSLTAQKSPLTDAGPMSGTIAYTG
jgi:hypothetical protein